MSTDRPTLTPAAEQALCEREARQAAALRENLRRRKQQARTRLDGAAGSGTTDLGANADADKAAAGPGADEAGRGANGVVPGVDGNRLCPDAQDA